MSSEQLRHMMDERRDLSDRELILCEIKEEGLVEGLALVEGGVLDGVAEREPLLCHIPQRRLLGLQPLRDGLTLRRLRRHGCTRGGHVAGQEWKAVGHARRVAVSHDRIQEFRLHHPLKLSKHPLSGHTRTHADKQHTTWPDDHKTRSYLLCSRGGHTTDGVAPH